MSGPRSSLYVSEAGSGVTEPGSIGLGVDVGATVGCVPLQAVSRNNMATSSTDVKANLIRSLLHPVGWVFGPIGHGRVINSTAGAAARVRRVLIRQLKGHPGGHGGSHGPIARRQGAGHGSPVFPTFPSEECSVGGVPIEFGIRWVPSAGSRQP